jgi:hypothetical protein
MRNNAFGVLNAVVVLSERFRLLVEIGEAFGDVSPAGLSAIEKAPNSMELLHAVFRGFFFDEFSETT